ncbi:MAG TPA: glycoside hydrolase family 9 protein [Clostridia bacterium]|nr:glycoside hydrolase family 9 protein [Clostridia bacterium]
MTGVSWAQPAPTHPPNDLIRAPHIGDHALYILSPTLLELYLVNTKEPGGDVQTWDWVNDQGVFLLPNPSALQVRVNGQTRVVANMGFKRRAQYAPLLAWDLRIGNRLYLRLDKPIEEGALVEVVNDGSLWSTNLDFSATAEPLRYNPAIHVNQEGYLPGYPKQAMVGQYLGDMGELAIPTNRFLVVNAKTGATVHEGMLVLRPDTGYLYTPPPCQNVYEADFSALTSPGQYLVVIPGMGASLPFRVDEGIGMGFARTFALGMLHQRSGTEAALPFTRFTHATNHVEPAAVPTNASPPFVFTWHTISNYAIRVNSENPPHTASRLTNASAQLFPFINQGTVSAPGGHFEAGDYNRVTYNGAQIVHSLVFAADCLPGAGDLDNLGIPESGDGISDLLQESKWEADFLARVQDADGAFYYSVYPRDREYELDVLPEHGDPQVVWPKNTATTAAAVAALAQCASSPRFKQAYPEAASNYLAKAETGWSFLTNAIAHLGLAGAYQRIQHFDDNFTHMDELAWAACEMYLATGDPQYQAKLFEWFPDPTSNTTFRYGWARMHANYGNATRSYAFAVRSGRLGTGQVQPDYMAKCHNVITNSGNDLVTWSQETAYGTSLPRMTKVYRGGGWYFSSAWSFDLVVAHQIDPRPQYLETYLRNLNYEAGCNPVNVMYVTGLGWKRLHNIVDQYSLNDRRTLPKDGMHVSNIQTGFLPVWVYGWELDWLSYPADNTDVAPYPYYDRWCDDWNVSTEGSTTDIARSLAGTAWLAARTSVATQIWQYATATISTPDTARLPGRPITVRLQAPGLDFDAARIVWEAGGQEPAFGGPNHTFIPGPEAGTYWFEAEVQWPDGRRVFAMGSVAVSSNAPPELTQVQKGAGGEISFQLFGAPLGIYIIQASGDLVTWDGIATNDVPPNGVLAITDTGAALLERRYYRALQQ